MSIEKKCDNCCVCEKAGDETYDIYKCLCSDDKPCFSPKEEVVRQDVLSEKIKIENDIEVSLQASTYTIDELLMIIRIANNSSNIFKKYKKEK